MMLRIGKFFYKWSGTLVPLVMLVLAVLVRSWDPQILTDLRFRIFDQYQSLKPREFHPNIGMRPELQEPGIGVGIIDLDEESLAKYGQWPWPRDLLAALVKASYEQGAAAVGFDIVFAEPDRTSLDIVVPRLDPKEPAYDGIRAQYQSLRDLNPALTDNDRSFAEELRVQPTVVLGFSFGENPDRRAPLVKKGVAYGGSNPFYVLHNFPGGVPNLAALEDSVAGVGSFNVDPERDGIIRRVPIVFAMGTSPDKMSLYPSLAAEMLRLLQGQNQSLRLKLADGSGEYGFGGGGAGVVKAAIGKMIIPTDLRGTVWLYDSGHKQERYLPAWKVLERSVEPDRMLNRLWFVGTSAAGLQDIRATPLDHVVPGVEVHAQIAEQVLSETYLNRPDFADGAEIVYMIVLGIIMIIMISRFNAIWGAIVGAVAVTTAIGFSWWSFSVQHFLFDPIYPSFAALSVYLAGSIINFMKTEAEKRQVRGAFSRYLSPALVEQLAKHPEKLQLGGEMRDMTLLFSDIRGFTPISEQFDPPGLTKFINGFMTPMTDIILSHQGTIDKYMGDAIMAFWNAPLDVPDHSLCAARAGLEMFRRVVPINEKLKKEAAEAGRKYLPINIGAGLNSGPVCVGNMGSDQRFDYSVLGDTVNLAARLEGQSKTYGVNIVIGPRTYQDVKNNIAALELDKIKVKGKTIPVQIYCALGEEDMLKSDKFQQHRDLHEKMIAAYRAQKFQEASDMCKTLTASMPEIHGLYALYEHRIEDFQEASPGPEWDGVYTAKDK